MRVGHAIVVLGALQLVAAVATAPASACTGPCSSPYVIRTVSEHVAPGGTLLIACSDCERDSPPLEAIDAEGRVTAGALEVVEESVDPTWLVQAVPTLYMRWTPAQPLAPGRYRLRSVQAGAYCGENRLALEWTVPTAASEAAGPLEVTAELTAKPRGTGTEFTCGDRCDPKFLHTQRTDVPTIWLAPQLTASDPRVATHLARLVAEEPGGERFGTWTLLKDLLAAPNEREFTEDIVLWFFERRPEYCVALEVFDVVKNQRARVGRTCVKDDLGELETRASYGRCALDRPQSEYDQAFCADNRDLCRERPEMSGCRDWLEKCGGPTDAGVDAGRGADAGVDAGGDGDADAAASPASDGAVADAASDRPDASSEPDAGVRERAAGERLGRGCGCRTVGGPSSRSGAWIVLLLGALLAVRRHR